MIKSDHTQAFEVCNRSFHMKCKPKPVFVSSFRIIFLKSRILVGTDLESSGFWTEFC